MGLRKEHYLLAFIVAVGLALLLAEPSFAQASGISQVEGFLRRVSSTLAQFVGAVGIIIIIIGGYMYMTSSGNPEKHEKAKSTMKWAFFGMVIVIGAIALANIVTSIAKQSFGG